MGVKRSTLKTDKEVSGLEKAGVTHHIIDLGVFPVEVGNLNEVITEKLDEMGKFHMPPPLSLKLLYHRNFDLTTGILHANIKLAVSREEC
jgi:hypothetical protein